MQSARLILEVMRFVHHEDDHRGRVSEKKSSHASYFQQTYFQQGGSPTSSPT